MIKKNMLRCNLIYTRQRFPVKCKTKYLIDKKRFGT